MVYYATCKLGLDRQSFQAACGIWVLVRRIMGSRAAQMKQPHKTLQAPALALIPNQSRHPLGFRVVMGFQESSRGIKHAASQDICRSGLVLQVAEHMLARSSAAGRSAGILSSSRRRRCQSCGHGQYREWYFSLENRLARGRRRRGGPQTPFKETSKKAAK